MDRFLIFAGGDYYEKGVTDFVGHRSTLEQAKAFAKECLAVQHGDHCPSDWAHVMDTKTGDAWEGSLPSQDAADTMAWEPVTMKKKPHWWDMQWMDAGELAVALGAKVGASP